MINLKDFLILFLKENECELTLKQIRDKNVPNMEYYYQGQLDFISKLYCFFGVDRDE